MRTYDLEIAALAGAEQAAKTARVRLTLARSSLARSDAATAAYHAQRGLELLQAGGAAESELARSLRAVLEGVPAHA